VNGRSFTVRRRPPLATQTRQEIFDTAGLMFAELGYHATSVRDIARALDLQPGALYNHFASKEDVLWQIVNRAADQFLEAAEGVAETEPAERLRRLIQGHVRVIAANLRNATVFFHEWKFLTPDRRTQIAERRDRYEAHFRRAIAEGMASGVFAPGDPKFAALVILGALNWTYQWFDPAGPLHPEEVAGKIHEFAARSLASGRAAQPEDR